MADFIDSEAEESEDEELDIQDKKKLTKLQQFDDEDDEEEEDDEEKIREELRDLIDDEPIDEESESGGESSEGEEGKGNSGEKRKKHEEDFDDRLEDEDYDLLEENLGRKVERRKRFKRLRRIEDEESEGEGGEGEGEGEERDAIANELFDSSDNEDETGSVRQSVHDRYDVEDEGDEEYSDTDDFIVDDEGRPIAEKRKKRKPIFSDAALQEAQDIFGVDFDYGEFGKYDEGDYEDEEDEEDEYIDEEDEGRRRRPKKTTSKKPTKKSIFEIYEPSELKKGHFTDFDIKVRQTDIPERIQLRDIPVTSLPEGDPELDEEADWIYRTAFCKPTVSSQEWSDGSDLRGRSKKDPQTIGKIRKALEFMRNQHLEVPFISFYRKEYVQPELNIHDLFRVYKFDAKWCQLHSRKTTLLSLMEKMKEYQTEQLTNDMNAPIPEHIRLITDEDIERLKNVQTTEELRDVHTHFLLYYAQDIKAMQESVKAKERSAAANKPKQKKVNEDGEEVEEEEEEEARPEQTLQEPTAVVKKGARSGPYALCCRAGLGSFAKRFGLKPEQFAENLRDNYQRHDVDQETGSPLEIAKEYISPKFPTPDDVLRASKFVVATQLSREPLVRSSMREIFYENAKIDVHPTKKGLKEVDENHPCFGLKYLKDKPVKDLKDDQYLKLYMAHQDKLLSVTISHQVKGVTSTSFIDEVKQLYYRDEFMLHVQEWNTVRSDCVEIALKKMLLPELSKELHARLIEESKEFIAKACARKLFNWIKVAPFTVEFGDGDDDDDDWETSKGLRIMGLAYMPDLSQASFACMIAPDGECTDFLRLPHLLKRKNSFREEEKMLKEADLAALKNFIYTKKPHAVAVGGESREALMVVADLKEIISNLVEDEQFPQIPVELVDNEFAKIYSNSKKGDSDFRDYPALLRQAVSLARRLQDPLVEFSQLCTHEEEILCLRYHTLQEQLPKEELLDIITTEFVCRVNEVGVDINEVVNNPYCSNLVQFICGLGPRKAAMLLKLLKQTNQRLENRTQLVTTFHMGPKVFVNCAGFIKIDTNALGDSTEAYVEVLDGSRVHPETYEWARKMAVDALEYEDEDANPAGALEEILDKPEKLKDLDLDAFAEELERQKFGNKSITLYDIRSELSHRYKDMRVAYQSPGPELLFDILTKETPETFYVGKLVTATVIGISHKKPEKDWLDHANPERCEETGLWQCPFCLKNDFPELSEVWNHFDAGGCPGQAVGVRVRLDNGVSGYIHIKNLSDKHVTDPSQRVQRGQLIHCRIIKIDAERFSVEATSKSSDLVDKNHEWRPPKDQYYDHEMEAKDIQAEEDVKRMKQKQTYVKRVIVHPAFRNISYSEAQKLMETMEQGEVLIRPSSRGADHLTVTWKVADNIYQHIDVREEKKDNAFSLGKSLIIGDESFEDLDEIIARHVNPMASSVRDLFSFRYYKDTEGGLKDKAEEYIKEEKRKNPAKIHYIVSVAKNYPGKFLLSYLPRARCKHEYISVTPNGFRFRGQLFDSVNSLFRWFKEHFKDPIPGTPSTPRTTAAARTPFTTPGTTATMPISMSAEAIQRVAQNLPSHMMHTLSQVASHTPHYAHTPAAFSTTTSYGYPNTPYTPSGQTPYMTPYTNATPRYGGIPGGVTPGGMAAPSPAQQSTSSGSGVFVHPGSVTPRGGTTPRGSGTPAYARGGLAAEDWRRAAEEWASRKKLPSPATTPRHTPRHQETTSPAYASPRFHHWKSNPYSQSPYDPGEPSPDRPPSSQSKYDPMEASPNYAATPRSARSTPRTINSPHSMSLGDSTPLYDESI